MGRPAATGLTRAQIDVLDVIRKHFAAHGYAPTMREILAARGLSSQGVHGVSEHLDELERKGFITREKGKTRTIRIVEQPGEERAS